MNYYYIIRPLIGAGIGYVTNWIAVKMMFRPLKAIKIGNFTLPFTPGIIPKNKSRLAESIGITVSKDLLSQEDLKKALLSDDIKFKIQEAYTNFIEKNNMQIDEQIKLLIGEENFNNISINIKQKITNSIYNAVLEANLGNIVAEQIEIASKEKLKGSIIGIFGGNSIVSSITSSISTKLNEYIKDNGQTVIGELVDKELNKYMTKSVSETFGSNIEISSTFMELYENLILEKMPKFLNTINISKIVEDKINSMDVLELEKLILTIMKKELNALVNLGAIIGFILGLLNLLF